MSIFLDKIFDNYGQFDKKAQTVKKAQVKLLNDNTFTVDDVVDYLITFDKAGDYKTPSRIAAPLYYLSQIDITKKVLGYKPNSSEYLLGKFSDEFYTKLYKKLSPKSKSYIFSWIPPKLQTDEMLLDYFKDNIESDFSNYHNTAKPSEDTLLKLLDINFVPVVRSMKKNWWTKKLKDKVLKVNPAGVVFMSSKIVTKDEIIKYFREDEHASKMYNQLFRGSKFDEVFQKDSEIRAEFVLRLREPSDISMDFYNECDYDFFRIYLERREPIFKQTKFVNLIPDDMIDNTLIDLIIEKLPYEALKSLRTNLDNTQLKTLYNNAKKNRIGYRSNIVQLIYSMKRAKLFNISMLDDFDGITFKDLEWTLSDDQLKDIMTPEVVDYFFEKEDQDFFKTKKSMKTAGILDAKKLLILMKNLNYTKLKSRINFGITEDDFIYIFLTARSEIKDNSKQIKVFNHLLALMTDGYINVSEDIKNQLDELPDDTTYESFIDAQEMFLF